MKKSILLLLLFTSLTCASQEFTIVSPDKNIIFSIYTGDTLMYSVSFKGREIVGRSRLGFEFQDEPALTADLEVIRQSPESLDESWEPVVPSKHSVIKNNYNGLHLTLREKSAPLRMMDFFVRSYNDGVAFRYRLPRGNRPGNRKITKELTAFTIPGNPKSWVVEYGGYSTSNESEFFERPLSYVSEKTVAGMPFLMEYPGSCWVAITEALIDNYAAFYIGTTGKQNQLTTKLVPVPGEQENGVKVRFDNEVFTPWRVLMAGETPGL